MALVFFAGLSAARDANLSRTAIFRWASSQAQSLSKIASAASLVFSHLSPAGPTQEGQPLSQPQPAISSRVRRSKISWTRKSGSLKPMPPG